MPINIPPAPPMGPLNPEEPGKNSPPARTPPARPLPVPTTESPETSHRPIRANSNESADPRLSSVVQRALPSPKISSSPLPSRNLNIPLSHDNPANVEESSFARHARFNASLIEREPTRPFSGTTLPALPKILVPQGNFVDKANQAIITRVKTDKRSALYLKISGLFVGSAVSFAAFAAITGFLILSSNPVTAGLAAGLFVIGFLSFMKSMLTNVGKENALNDIKKQLNDSIKEIKDIKEAFKNVQVPTEQRELLDLKERLYEGLRELIDESLDKGKLPVHVDKVVTLTQQHQLLIEKSENLERILEAADFGKNLT